MYYPPQDFLTGNIRQPLRFSWEKCRRRPLHAGLFVARIWIIRVDCALLEQRNVERDYWIIVLERIVETVEFLAPRVLAFRCDDEVIGSKHNENYLSKLELIAKFDQFLKEHISKFGNAGHEFFFWFVIYYLLKIFWSHWRLSIIHSSGWTSTE